MSAFTLGDNNFNFNERKQDVKDNRITDHNQKLPPRLTLPAPDS